MEKTFELAVAEYFGLKEGQSVEEFIEEVKLLSMKDRIELAVLLRKKGINVRSPYI